MAAEPIFRTFLPVLIGPKWAINPELKDLRSEERIGNCEIASYRLKLLLTPVSPSHISCSGIPLAIPSLSAFGLPQYGSTRPRRITHSAPSHDSHLRQMSLKVKRLVEPGLVIWSCPYMTAMRERVKRKVEANQSQDT